MSRVNNAFFNAAIALGCALAAPTGALLAQDFSCDRGQIEVRGLVFEGNKTFSDAELTSVIVTTPSSWGRRTFNLPFSAKRCLDAEELKNDRLRLILLYRKRGFPEVDVSIRTDSISPTKVKVRVMIWEGNPILLSTLHIAGLDSVNGRSALVSSLPLKDGDRFDRLKIEEVMDTITRRLRNRGYPSVSARNSYFVTGGSRIDSSAVGGNRSADNAIDSLVDTDEDGSTLNSPEKRLQGVQRYAYDTIFISTGPLTRIGDVKISVEPAQGRTRQISDKVIKSIVGLDSGGIYREQNLLSAQRSLYETDAFWHVGIGLDSAGGRKENGDSIAPLSVALVENMMHSARLGVGYGTLDCFRATGELDNYNFLQRARRLELRARVSKIGVGRPLDGASGLCPQAKNDPYSDRLNYYLGATWRQPVFFGLRTVPTITAYTQRVSEYNAYVRTTSIGGIASLVWRRGSKSPLTFAYSMDYGRTEAQPSLFCAVFNICTKEDRDRVQTNQRLGVLSVALSRNKANHPTSPTKGSIGKLEFRHASPWVLSDSALRFNTIIGEISKYIGLTDRTVLALNLRAGMVLGRDLKPSVNFIPPQERMYGGGPTSVRGFRQNELGAVAYTTSSFEVDSTSSPGNYYLRLNSTDPEEFRRAVPVGGNSMVVANVEYRFRTPFLPNVLEFALFTDVGDVWNRGNASVFKNFDLKVTPGVQASAHTPIGPVRVILGYNPYKKVSGPIYYEGSNALTGGLPCVSPSNTLNASKDPVSGEWIQQEGSCPATFTPTHRQNFRSKLTLNLAIGQAF